MSGPKSRFRTTDDLEAIVRDNYRQGITTFFMTDDNMARNKHWEEFFDRLIELKENEAIELSLIIQVDTQCHQIEHFIHKARCGWCVPRVHRTGERQSRQPAGRQETPEQDHRLSQDAAGVAHRRRLDLGRLYSGFPR